MGPLAGAVRLTGGQAVIVDGPASLPLEQSQPPIYDRPIGLRQQNLGMR